METNISKHIYLHFRLLIGMDLEAFYRKSQSRMETQDSSNGSMFVYFLFVVSVKMMSLMHYIKVPLRTKKKNL